MRNTLTVLWIATPLLFACAPLDPATEETPSLRAPIVGGKTHTGHPSVGLLQRMSGYMCTATLVGQRTVLTAAHCVDLSTTHYFIVDGSWHPVASVHPHPSYDAANHHTNDLAIVRLGSSIGIAPSAVSSLPPSAGQIVTLVGFGKTAEDAADSGTKRIATNTVASVLSTTLEYYGAGGNICNGDSGGPGFATIQGQEVQVGVHSLKLGNCGYGGVDTRVDVFKDWIVKTAGGDVLIGPAAKPEPQPDPEPEPEPQPQPPAPAPVPDDADADGIPDAEDLCSNTPAGATVWSSGEWKGCAGGQSLDKKPPKPEPEPQPEPQPGNDADGDGIPDAEDRCDQTPPAWKSGVHKTGAYLGCYPNGDVITG